MDRRFKYEHVSWERAYVSGITSKFIQDGEKIYLPSKHTETEGRSLGDIWDRSHSQVTAEADVYCTRWETVNCNKLPSSLPSTRSSAKREQSSLASHQSTAISTKVLQLASVCLFLFQNDLWGKVFKRAIWSFLVNKQKLCLHPPYPTVCILVVWKTFS